MFQTSLFGPLEKALAATFDSESVRTTGFRGWITNLQRLGVLGKKARVGRGAPLTYGPDEWHRLFFALELCECGFPPAVTVEVIEAYWESKLKTIFKRAEDAVQFDKPDVVVILGGVRLRSGPWSSHKGVLASVPHISGITLSELARYAVGDLPQRMIVINLTKRLRRFHEAFSELHMDEPLAANRPKQSVKEKDRRR